MYALKLQRRYNSNLYIYVYQQQRFFYGDEIHFTPQCAVEPRRYTFDIFLQNLRSIVGFQKTLFVKFIWHFIDDPTYYASMAQLEIMQLRANGSYRFPWKLLKRFKGQKNRTAFCKTAGRPAKNHLICYTGEKSY